MGNFGDSAGPRLIDAGRRRRRAWALPRGVGVLALLVCVLSGCAGHDSGAFLIDPGRYDLYKCDDFAARWKLVTTREKELRALMDRASQTGGGAVVGSLAYRTEYEEVLSDERLMQRTAAAKNCTVSLPVGVTLQQPALQPVPMQSGPPLASQPQAGQAPGGATQNTLYQSDQGIR
jgi:hypothetical protein